MPCSGFCGCGREGEHLPECHLLALRVGPVGLAVVCVDSGGRLLLALVSTWLLKPCFERL